MIYINSQEIRYFYRNIVKTGDVYRVKHNNKDYGEFSKLSDALYERDALFFCNFDYDLLVECDLENKYENMELPPFPEKRPKGRIKGTKINKKEREGEILFNHKKRKFYIKRMEDVIGYYDTMTEAFYYKKLLMDNDWDKSVLKTNISERIEVNIVIDQNKEYKVQLNFCPKCKSRLKIGVEECPSCGINIEEYLYNN
ncbi:zinc ribbon domain-containing protein [Methanobrevibacter sp.]|uniref:zinc ribbon domain-containing protein n=1 Tax=Methanobrevibacter sp. TaxID=66852 RepID=UPI0025E85748|nr:zinc ribbon domain-containing protein [Methanobrevibacter sp.]MBQ2831690.1 zinc ribbon domain-containing protein [Methanobrevibacter sp.]